MTKWEMIWLPNRLATLRCEQFFAFVCQVEWGIPPGEAADLLGYSCRGAEAPRTNRRQANEAEEARK